jgi:hypothetical protein
LAFASYVIFRKRNFQITEPTTPRKTENHYQKEMNYAFPAHKRSEAGTRRKGKRPYIVPKVFGSIWKLLMGLQNKS